MTLAQVPATVRYQGWTYTYDASRPARERWVARRGHFHVHILTASSDRGIKKRIDDTNDEDTK